MASWIVCQVGAREHYAIPRALHQVGQLNTLLTDAWVPPQIPTSRLLGKVSQSLIDRYHSDLATASVKPFTRGLLSFELGNRMARTDGWPLIVSRNQWFQRRALRILKQLEKQFAHGERPILFSYSYTALTLFRYAKQTGWRTVLGQIDPGLTEQNQVAQLQENYSQKYSSTWNPAPDIYWQNWQQECQLADRILVNSAWSQQALNAINISSDKVAIAPLAYQAPAEAKSFVREYPDAFTTARPLRVLFLGQIILRKGIAAVIEAAAALIEQPIEIWLVGTTELELAEAIGTYPKIKWFGTVPRSQVQQYYQQSDIFLFPTHSDGFGLTQLEAQAWKLPIIASHHCGEVVTHQQNGLVLADVSGKSIAALLLDCCQSPQRLRQWSEQSIDMNRYSLSQLAKTLQNTAHALI